MGFFDSGYQPTAKDKWNLQQRDERDRRSRRDADAREAQRIRQQMVRDELKAEQDRQRMVDGIRAQAEKEAAAEEKQILTRPFIRRVGGTDAIKGGIFVWHYRAEPPESLSIKQRRSGLGIVFGLPRGGGLESRDALLWTLRNNGKGAILDQHPDWVEASTEAIKDMKTRYLQLFRTLRDDKQIGYMLHAAGVTMDRTVDEQMVGTYGTYTRRVTERSIPTLTDVVIRPSGLELTYAARLGDSAKNWNAKIDPLRNAFRGLGVDASALTITDDAAGNILLRFNDRDPFSGATIESGEFDASRGRSLLGITSRGDQAWITWAGSSGMVVGGVPGSGKTASMLPVFAGMAGQCELHVFDGKSGYDLHPLRHIARTYDRSGDIDAPLIVLRALDALRERRAEVLHTKLHANNFWNVPVSDRQRLGLVPIFLILDEVQTWLDTSGMDKEEKAISAEITKLIRTLIQKARSVGIVTVLTTQKPDSTSVPTVIRDNAALKLSFRVSTPEQAITVLGKQAPCAPDPTDIPMSAKGRGVMETEGHGIVLLQAGYESPESLEQRLAGIEPVPDQGSVVDGLLGGRTSSTPPCQRFESAVTEPEPAQQDTAVPDDLLEALAEAQRRGLIPSTEAAPEPVPPSRTPVPPPALPDDD